MRILKMWTILSFLILFSPTTTAQDLMPLSGKSDEAKQLMRQAWHAQQDGYFKKANKLVEKALELDDDFPMALLFKPVQDSIGFTQKIKKLRSLKSSFTEGEEVFFRIAFNREDKETVIASAKKLLRNYPKDYYLLTQIYYPVKGYDVELAKELLLTILKSDEGFPPAHNLLGYTYLEEKEFEKSLQHFSKYLELVPDLPNAYDSNGDYYLTIEDYQKATEMYDRAYSLDKVEFAVSKEKAQQAREKLNK